MTQIKGLVIFVAALAAHAEGKFRVQVIEASAIMTVSEHGADISAFAKVVLPNGDHADLLCNASEGHCAKIDPVVPEKMAPDATHCSTLGHQTQCTTHNPGEYIASRKGNTLTIEAPNGKLRFRIVGSW